MSSPLTPQERFWSFVDTSGECWEWTGCKNAKGYGMFDKTWKGTARAHRISWIIENGDIPEGMFICHHCDNPACVNPDHLFVGTALDNYRDAMAKGRLIGIHHPDSKSMKNLLHPIGEENPAARLTEPKVQVIRAEYAGGAAIKHLAREFQVTPRTIRDVVRRKTWTHV